MDDHRVDDLCRQLADVLTTLDDTAGVVILLTLPTGSPQGIESANRRHLSPVDGRPDLSEVRARAGRKGAAVTNRKRWSSRQKSANDGRGITTPTPLGGGGGGGDAPQGDRQIDNLPTGDDDRQIGNFADEDFADGDPEDEDLAEHLRGGVRPEEVSGYVAEARRGLMRAHPSATSRPDPER